MIQQVFFHLFGILSSISSSPFDTEILSELLSQSVVSVYSWNTLLLFHLAVLIHLGQVTFCRQVLLLICFSGLGPISLVSRSDVTPIIYCVFTCKPWSLPIKTGGTFVVTWVVVINGPPWWGCLCLIAHDSSSSLGSVFLVYVHLKRFLLRYH